MHVDEICVPPVKQPTTTLRFEEEKEGKEEKIEIEKREREDKGEDNKKGDK